MRPKTDSTSCFMLAFMAGLLTAFITLAAGMIYFLANGYTVLALMCIVVIVALTLVARYLLTELPNAE